MGRKAKPSADAASERLESFGQLLGAARAKLTQAEMAHRLSALRKQPVSQSYIAQLEKGKLLNPNKALLMELAKLYGVEYRRLAAAVFADKFDLPVHALIATRELQDLSGLARWEKQLPAGSELWIGAPNFVDVENDELFDVVVGLLKNNCRVIYFVDARDTGPGRKFNQLIAKFAQHPELSSEQVPEKIDLDPNQVGLLITSFVIANPGRAVDKSSSAEGYIIINKLDGTPELGIKMSAHEIRYRIDLLHNIVTKAKIVPIKKTGTN